MADWRVVWCPSPYCNQVAVGVFSPEDVARIIVEHKSECGGLRFEREVAEMRMEGRWQRVARRWGLPDEAQPEIKIHAGPEDGVNRTSAPTSSNANEIKQVT